MEDRRGCLERIFRFLTLSLLCCLTLALWQGRPLAQNAMPIQENTLARVQARGSLVCGMAHADLPGFFAQRASGRYEGFYADICRALAAATLGNSEAVRFYPLPLERWFSAVQTGEVDVLLGSITWTSSRDAEVDFATVIFHEGRNHYSPVVKAADDQWLDVVSWVMFALIQAEEWGLSSSIIDAAVVANPQLHALQRFAGYESELVSSLGLASHAFRDTIHQVGHYGEIYNRHFGEQSLVPLPRGLNHLWIDGGLMYAPPLMPN